MNCSLALEEYGVYLLPLSAFASTQTPAATFVRHENTPTETTGFTASLSLREDDTLSNVTALFYAKLKDEGTYLYRILSQN